MGATSNKDKMTLIVDTNEFYDRVGLVWNYYELEWLGFKPFDYSGNFDLDDLPQLQEFCQLNPEYHIVSGFPGGRKINKFVPDARCYWIANGDKDPTLMLNFLLNPNLPLIMEDVITAATAVLRDIKNRRERE
jgi:hypothetical protein